MKTDIKIKVNNPIIWGAKISKGKLISIRLLRTKGKDRRETKTDPKRTNSVSINIDLVTVLALIPFWEKAVMRPKNPQTFPGAKRLISEIAQRIETSFKGISWP